MQGAVFFDWTKDAIDTSTDTPVQMQMQPDLLAAALEAKGVNSGKPVLVRSITDYVHTWVTGELHDSISGSQVLRRLATHSS